MQTAVEWLFEQVWITSGEDLPELLEQAKEMEKQQIIDAHIEGQRVFDKHPHTQWTNDQSEHYYADTYGSKGSDDLPKVQNKDSFGEISDEEIEKAAAHYEPMITRRAWISACKWYREQLKQRQ